VGISWVDDRSAGTFAGPIKTPYPGQLSTIPRNLDGS
jgi:hypothetical protein